MTLYRRFKIKDFTLRDYLALERTILSNERTLLAYLRTGLAFFITGVTGAYFFSELSKQWISVVVAIIGLAFSFFGVIRFHLIKNRLDIASPAETADVTAERVSTSEPRK